MKLKTHKATAKKIKVSPTGKFLRAQAAKSHLLSNKTNRSKLDIEISGSDIKRVKKLAPYLK